nr:MAG TPA: hypothetical protein [Caudoviricetes sp.]
MTRFVDIKSDPRSHVGTFRAIKRNSVWRVGEYTADYDRTFGAIAEGDFVTVSPEMVSNKPAFTIWPNAGGRVKFYTLWGGKYPLRKLDAESTPWEVPLKDIFDSYVVTDGYILMSSGTMFSVIEQEHEEQLLQKLFTCGGVIDIYDDFTFGRWFESLKSEVKNVISSLRRVRMVDKYTKEKFDRITFEDPRVRIFGPRKDRYEGWTNNIQRVW